MTHPNEATIAAHVVQAYGRNLRLEPQEMQSKFLPWCDADTNFTEKGDSWSDYSLRKRKMRKVQGRFGDTPNFVGKREKRIGYFDVFDDGEMFDSVDAANVLLDPKNGTMLNMRYAIPRERDIAIWEGAMGTTQAGEKGELSRTLPAANQIAITEKSRYRGLADGEDNPLELSDETPLTPAKVRFAKTVLDKSLIPGPRVLSCSSDQLGVMMTSKEVTDADLAMIKALHAGEITFWHGFNWAIWEECPDDTDTVQYSGAWCKAAVQYRGRPITEFDIGPRRDKQINIQAYHKMRHGAMRLEDTGVCRIACKRV